MPIIHSPSKTENTTNASPSPHISSGSGMAVSVSQSFDLLGEFENKSGINVNNNVKKNSNSTIDGSPFVDATGAIVVSSSCSNMQNSEVGNLSCQTASVISAPPAHISTQSYHAPISTCYPFSVTTTAQSNPQNMPYSNYANTSNQFSNNILHPYLNTVHNPYFITGYPVQHPPYNEHFYGVPNTANYMPLNQHQSFQNFHPNPQVNSKQVKNEPVTQQSEINNSSRQEPIIKLNAFWKDQPRGWFEYVETLFNAKGVHNEDFRFQSVIAALDYELRKEVRDLIERPPLIGKFEALKDRLEEQFSESSRSKIKTLLSRLQLGDRRPSQFLRDIKVHADGKCDDDFIKEIWFERLPEAVRIGLASIPSDSQTLDELAKIADSINEAITYSKVNAVTNRDPHPNSQKHSNSHESQYITQTQFNEAIQNLTKQMEKMCRNQETEHRRESNISSNHGRNRSRSRNRYDRRLDMCFYHQIFGDKAKRCVDPCNYKSDKSNLQKNT